MVVVVCPRIFFFPADIFSRSTADGFINMIHQSVKRELLTGLEYLLIGVIAIGAVLRWFSEHSPLVQMLSWTTIAIMLGLLRFIILYASEWFRRDQWRSVSRRREW